MALEALKAGGKAALARAISRLEERPDDPRTLALLDAALAAPRGTSLGLTGPPGVGKSTLLDALIRAWRAKGRTVGVVAVDPSSSATRGALLGDRTRLSTDPADQGVFVRSMAAGDRLGGLAALAFPAMVLMCALFDEVVVETVGVGQSETEVAGLADRILFCAQPASGDALQFMKAGVMEIPDLVLVTKADLGAPASRAVADLRSALSLGAPGARVPEVLAVSAARGEGLEAAIAAIDGLAPAPGEAAARHAAQARAWVERTLAARIGTEGLAAARAAGRLGGAGMEAPFAELAAILGDARHALGAAFR